MPTRVKLHRMQMQNPSEREFWGKNKLWEAVSTLPNGNEDKWEFHALDRAEAERSVKLAMPNAVFYSGGIGKPPVKKKRKA
jgi:hypothetical protein